MEGQFHVLVALAGSILSFIADTLLQQMISKLRLLLACF